MGLSIFVVNFDPTDGSMEMHAGGRRGTYVYVKDAARKIGEWVFHAVSNDKLQTRSV